MNRQLIHHVDIALACPSEYVFNCHRYTTTTQVSTFAGAVLHARLGGFPLRTGCGLPLTSLPGWRGLRAMATGVTSRPRPPIAALESLRVVPVEGHPFRGRGVLAEPAYLAGGQRGAEVERI